MTYMSTPLKRKVYRKQIRNIGKGEWPWPPFQAKKNRHGMQNQELVSAHQWQKDYMPQAK